MGFYFRLFQKIRFLNGIKYQYISKLFFRSFITQNQDEDNQPFNLYKHHVLLKQKLDLEFIFFGIRQKKLQDFFMQNQINGNGLKDINVDLLYTNQKNPNQSAIQNIEFVQDGYDYSKDDQDTVISQYIDEKELNKINYQNQAQLINSITEIRNIRDDSNVKYNV